MSTLVFLGAVVIGIALDHHLAGRIGVQPGAVVFDSRYLIGADERGVEIEKHRLHFGRGAAVLPLPGVALGIGIAVQTACAPAAASGIQTLIGRAIGVAGHGIAQ